MCYPLKSVIFFEIDKFSRKQKFISFLPEVLVCKNIWARKVNFGSLLSQKRNIIFESKKYIE